MVFDILLSLFYNNDCQMKEVNSYEVYIERTNVYMYSIRSANVTIWFFTFITL